MVFPELPILAWIALFSLLGGVLSVLAAASVSLNVSRAGLPVLISYAIGAMLAAVFFEILPEAIAHASNVPAVTGTVLIGILLFFTLEKLVIWRHCHGDHCEVHAPHDAEHCPEIEAQTSHTKFKAVLKPQPNISAKPQVHTHTHDDGRSAAMILIGDTFHNFVDGVLISSAFMVDIKVGVVTALAITAHEIPQEVGDFLILLHSGYSKQKALWFNLASSLATLLGAVLAYYFLQQATSVIPYILALAAASLLYVAVADLIPNLHKHTELNATITQLCLIGLGVATIGLVGYFLE